MVQRLRAVTRLHLAPHPHAARHPFDAPQNALKPPRPEQPRELALVRLVHVPGHVAQQAGFPHFAQGEALPGCGCRSRYPSSASSSTSSPDRCASFAADCTPSSSSGNRDARHLARPRNPCGAVLSASASRTKPRSGDYGRRWTGFESECGNEWRRIARDSVDSFALSDTYADCLAERVGFEPTKGD